MVVTSVFAAVALPLILTDVGEIQTGQPTEFQLDDGGFSYSITAVLESPGSEPEDNGMNLTVGVLEDEPPEAQFTVTTRDGTSITLEPEDRWTQIMDHSYRHMARFTPVDSSGSAVTEIIVTVQADPNQRFVLFRDPGSVMERNSGWAYGGWITSGVLLVAGAGGLLGFFAASSSERERDPDSDQALRHG